MNDKEKVIDTELQDSLVKLHDIQVEEEKQEIRGMTQGIALHTELALETEEIERQIDEVEEQIKATRKARRKYIIIAGVCFALCIITAVARYIAW